jgi:hypothetical protein
MKYLSKTFSVYMSNQKDPLCKCGEKKVFCLRGKEYLCKECYEKAKEDKRKA